MSDLGFTKPVMVFVGMDFLRSVGSIGEAHSYLLEWPQCRRGLFYYNALRACEAAGDGVVSAEQVRQALKGACREAKVLATDVDIASMLGGQRAERLSFAA